jgi:hypothetical protein
VVQHEKVGDDRVVEQSSKAQPFLFKKITIERIPLARHNRDVPVKLGATEALDPLRGDKVVARHALTSAAVNEKDSGEGDKRAKGIQTAHDVEEAVHVLQVCGSETSSVNKQVLLASNETRADLVLYGTCHAG